MGGKLQGAEERRIARKDFLHRQMLLVNLHVALVLPVGRSSNQLKRMASRILGDLTTANQRPPLINRAGRKKPTETNYCNSGAKHVSVIDSIFLRTSLRKLAAPTPLTMR